MTYDYSEKDIILALKKSGIRKNDLVFCHSDISLFGIPKCNISKQSVSSLFLRSFFKVLGSGGTLIIPTFTYSFPNKKIYDPTRSKNICGFLSSCLQKHRLGRMYLDPNLSCVVFGKLKKYFTTEASSNAYDENSLFSKFYKLNGKICNFNLDAGSTFLHFLERKLSVKYRFDKVFFGKIKFNNTYKKISSTLFVKPKKQKKQTSFKKFTHYVTKTNVYKKVSLGRGYVGVISSKNCQIALQKKIKKNQYFLFI